MLKLVSKFTSWPGFPSEIFQLFLEKLARPTTYSTAVCLLRAANLVPYPSSIRLGIILYKLNIIKTYPGRVSKKIIKTRCWYGLIVLCFPHFRELRQVLLGDVKLECSRGGGELFRPWRGCRRGCGRDPSTPGPCPTPSHTQPRHEPPQRHHSRGRGIRPASHRYTCLWSCKQLIPGYH